MKKRTKEADTLRKLEQRYDKLAQLLGQVLLASHDREKRNFELQDALLAANQALRKKLEENAAIKKDNE